MASEADRNVAMSLLREVDNRIKQTLGDTIAIKFDVNGYDAPRDIFCKEMVKQCELAEKKAPDDREVQYLSALYKANLYGCWQKMQGTRGTHKDALQAYETALRYVGGSPQLEALVRYRYGIM